MTKMSFMDNAMKPSSAKLAMKLGFPWALDNGVFTGKFNEEKFYQCLEERKPWAKTCLFVVAPDVMGDAWATKNKYLEHHDRIYSMGYPVAMVAQDGAEAFGIPLGSRRPDVVFIGGSTEWKLGRGAALVIKSAKELKINVHIGRVNGGKRYHKFAAMGADSCDGTCMVFGPKIHLQKIKSWVNQPSLEVGQ